MRPKENLLVAFLAGATFVHCSGGKTESGQTTADQSLDTNQSGKNTKLDLTLRLIDEKTGSDISKSTVPFSAGEAVVEYCEGPCKEVFELPQQALCQKRFGFEPEDIDTDKSVIVSMDAAGTVLAGKFEAFKRCDIEVLPTLVAKVYFQDEGQISEVRVRDAQFVANASVIFQSCDKVEETVSTDNGTGTQKTAGGDADENLMLVAYPPGYRPATDGRGGTMTPGNRRITARPDGAGWEATEDVQGVQKGLQQVVRPGVIGARRTPVVAEVPGLRAKIARYRGKGGRQVIGMNSQPIIGRVNRVVPWARPASFTRVVGSGPWGSSSGGL